MGDAVSCRSNCLRRHVLQSKREIPQHQARERVQLYRILPHSHLLKSAVLISVIHAIAYKYQFSFCSKARSICPSKLHHVVSTVTPISHHSVATASP